MSAHDSRRNGQKSRAKGGVASRLTARVRRQPTTRPGRRRKRVVVTIALASAVLVMLPTTALARTQVDRDTFAFEGNDPLLSEQCGTPVDLEVEIDITHHAFDDDQLRHRQEEKGITTYSSEHGTVVQRWRHAGPHEVVEVLEELEPDIFLVRVRAEANGILWLETGDGERLLRDAGTVTFDDIAIWDRTSDELVAVLERMVDRVSGPHPLLDDATYFSTVCGELAP